MLANEQPGDGIFFYTAPGKMTFDYYRWLSGKRSPDVIYPSSGGRMTYTDFLVIPLAEVLQKPLPEPKRVWLFLNEHRASGSMDMGSEVMCAWYAQRYRLVSTHRVDGIDVYLYSR